MAKIKLGPNITDIRGSFGEVVYSVAKRGVHYIRSKAPNPVNPNSSQQVAARTRLQSSIQRWFTVLTQAQRNTWEAMANRLNDIAPSAGQGGIRDLVPNVGGQMSGANAYAGFRARSIIAGLGGAFSDEAPVVEDQPTVPETVAPTYDSVTNTLTITWNDPSTVDAAGVVAIWLRSRERIYHKQFRTVVALGVQTVAMLDAKSTLGSDVNFADVEPTNMLVQLQTINPSGFASEGSATEDVVLAIV